MKLIGKLSKNTGEWMRGMSERLQPWVHAQELQVNLSRPEARMDPELADEIMNSTAESNVAGAWSRAAPHARARTLSAPWA